MDFEGCQGVVHLNPKVTVLVKSGDDSLGTMSGVKAKIMLADLKYLLRQKFPQRVTLVSVDGKPLPKGDAEYVHLKNEMVLEVKEE